MSKKFEQIIKYVHEYERLEQEGQQIKRVIDGYKKDLKDFTDTGKAWIRVTYNHNTSYETIYRGNDCPSDNVIKAVQEDIEKIITKLEKQQAKINEDCTAIRCIVENWK